MNIPRIANGGKLIDYCEVDYSYMAIKNNCTECEFCTSKGFFHHVCDDGISVMHNLFLCTKQKHDYTGNVIYKTTCARFQKRSGEKMREIELRLVPCLVEAWVEVEDED